MNTDTGQIYRGEMEIQAARRRGENVVRVSEKVAQIMEQHEKDVAENGGTRAQRRQLARYRKKKGFK
jgi:hypothetical protein